MTKTTELYELGERVPMDGQGTTAPLLEVRSRVICAGRCFWCEAAQREDERLRG